MMFASEQTAYFRQISTLASVRRYAPNAYPAPRFEDLRWGTSLGACAGFVHRRLTPLAGWACRSHAYLHRGARLGRRWARYRALAACLWPANVSPFDAYRLRRLISKSVV